MTRCPCAVVGCTNTTYQSEKNLRYFKLPSDPVKAKRWLKLIGRTEMKNYFVCEEHFSPEWLATIKSKYKRPSDALPTLKLPPSSEDIVMVHKSTQCSSAGQDSQEKQDKPSVTKKQKDLFHELCDKFLEEDIARIVQAQTDIKGVLNDHKHVVGYMKFCLKFYYSSPVNYLALQSSMGLPDQSKLRNYLITSISSEHHKLMIALKAKVDCMSDLEKECSVLIGFVNMKPHIFYHIKEDRMFGFVEKDGVREPIASDNAVVIIARGIYELWQLAIDYSLLPQDPTFGRKRISSWVLKNIEGLRSIGLNIRVCISNLSLDTIAASVEPESSPLYQHKPFSVVRDKQIYYMADLTYIIKKIHNYFKEYEFHSLNTVAKWQDVVDFYIIDSKRKLRLAPNLSEEHCCIDYETPYSCVVETLSEKVAAGMAACVEFGAMDEAAWGTVQFLTIMNNLIDFTHSCSTRHHRELKRPFEGSETQIQTITKALSYFQNLRLMRNNEDFPEKLDFIEDFQVAIKVLLMLSEDFRIENKPLLITRNINFNPITNFFDSLSKKSKTGQVLPWKLIEEFRKMFSRTILQTPKHRYCPEVLNGCFFEFLTSLNTDASNSSKKTNQSNVMPPRAGHLMYPVKMTDYDDFQLPKTNQLDSIGTFVLNKCLEIHKFCTIAKRKVTIYDDIVLTGHQRYPEYRYDLETQTIIPDAHFMTFISALEGELKTFLKGDFFDCFFLSALEARAQALSDPFRPPCPCFPVAVLKRLYFRLRLRIILKLNNRSYSNSAKEMKFKYISLN